MQIVSISGKAQHGKDTAAQFLRDAMEREGKKVLIIHYGDLVKFTCTAFCGWDGKKDEAGRSMLQRVGTERVRSKDPDYWVNYVLFMINALKSSEKWDYVLIPDCRFPNEIHGIHLRVERPDFDNGLTEEQKQHPSETALDDYPTDLKIFNSGTLEDLRDMCDLLVADAVHYFCDAQCRGVSV